mmetsp:Transcript_9665/g.29331  ORF Transcript_9665/g.29331 Transcript_9665/m.29331 type:complete len:228 (-) Transcript_9665:478-1161(-)
MLDVAWRDPERSREGGCDFRSGGRSFWRRRVLPQIKGEFPLAQIDVLRGALPFGEGACRGRFDEVAIEAFLAAKARSDESDDRFHQVLSLEKSARRFLWKPVTRGHGPRLGPDGVPVARRQVEDVHRMERDAAQRRRRLLVRVVRGARVPRCASAVLPESAELDVLRAVEHRQVVGAVVVVQRRDRRVGTEPQLRATAGRRERRDTLRHESFDRRRLSREHTAFHFQ